MKKRTQWVLALLAVLLISIMPFTVSATEGVADTIEVSIQAEEITDVTSSEEGGSENGGGFDLQMFYSRIWEFANKNRSDLLSLAGSAAIAIFTLIAKRSSDKKSSAISRELQFVKNDASSMSASQGSVINTVNNMIDGYNEMRLSYEKYEGVEDDRNKLIGAVFVQNTAILEILTTVYVNSKNMPQGVKDLVNLKYAKCLKSLESDESLRGVVEAVRKEIGVKDETEALEATEGSMEETGG